MCKLSQRTPLPKQKLKIIERALAMQGLFSYIKGIKLEDMSDGKTEAYRNSKMFKNVDITDEVKHNKYYYDFDRNKPYKDFQSTSTEFKSVWVGDKKEDLDYMPNQKWHQIISFIKSGIRIVGYALLPFNLVIATGVLILSEIIGIAEELV